MLLIESDLNMVYASWFRSLFELEVFVIRLRQISPKRFIIKAMEREALVKIAMESEANGCQLSPAIVNDFIVKQYAEIARATFSERVLNALDSIDEHLDCRILSCN